MKILPIKGTNSLNALHGFNALLLGYKMLPNRIAEDFDHYYESFKDKTDSEKEKVIREALMFVNLNKDEVEAICSFAADKNGIAYSAASIKNMELEDLFEVIVSVCMEIGRIKITLVSEDEKKKFRASQSMSVGNL
jgi:hypothetical protein